MSNIEQLSKREARRDAGATREDTASGAASPAPLDDGWLEGSPMDPLAVPAEPLAPMEGYPFLPVSGVPQLVGARGPVNPGFPLRYGASGSLTPKIV